jgi:hypothetical protein
MAIKRIDFYYLVHSIEGVDTVFEISDEDTSGDPQYYGYLNEQGGYIIQVRNSAAGTYRYKMGASGYAAAWAARAGGSYVYFNLL